LGRARTEQKVLRRGERKQFKYLIFKFIARAQNRHCDGAASWGVFMSKKGDQLRQKAEALRTIADNMHPAECRRISLELAVTAEELADEWDAIELTMAMVAAK
jgi:hypothetical protein